MKKNEKSGSRDRSSPGSPLFSQGSVNPDSPGKVKPESQRPAKNVKMMKSQDRNKQERSSPFGERERNVPYRELKKVKEHGRSPAEYGKALRDAREWKKASHSAPPELKASSAGRFRDHEGRDGRKLDHAGPAERPFAGGRNRGPDFMKAGKKVEYLFEDADFIVVEKPAGLPTIAGESSRAKNLYDMVTEHLKIRSPAARAAVVHRLDKDTSGILVFAKHARAKKALMEDWNERVRERGYTALVRGSMPTEEGVLESWLFEDSGGRVREVGPGIRGALRAVTAWKTLASDGYWSLLDLRLETGRKHQIRVQLAWSGHPIAGDSKYWRTGNPVSSVHPGNTGFSLPSLDMENPLGRLALHAHLLCFEHPFTKEVLRFESLPPESFRKVIQKSGFDRKGRN